MSEGVWQRSGDWVSQTIDGSIVLLDISSGVYYALNPTSSMIWETIEAPVTEEQIVTALRTRFDVEPDHCAASVERALADFETKGLAHRNG